MGERAHRAYEDAAWDRSRSYHVPTDCERGGRAR